MHNPNNLDSEPLKALDAVGGEPLTGSGFEDEAPEPEFSDSAEEGAN